MDVSFECFFLLSVTAMMIVAQWTWIFVRLWLEWLVMMTQPLALSLQDKCVIFWKPFTCATACVSSGTYLYQSSRTRHLCANRRAACGCCRCDWLRSGNAFVFCVLLVFVSHREIWTENSILLILFRWWSDANSRQRLQWWSPVPGCPVVVGPVLLH